MKHLNKFESYTKKRKLQDAIKESVMVVNDVYRVNTTVDIPQSLLNTYVKSVKDSLGKNARQFYSDIQLAEEITKYVVQNGLTPEKIPAGALFGGEGQGQQPAQGQSAPQAQMQVQPGQVQVQPQAQGQAQMQVQGQAQGQAQMQAQVQAQPQVQGQAQPQAQGQAQPQAQGQVQVQTEAQPQGQSQSDEDFEEVNDEDEENEEELPL